MAPCLSVDLPFEVIAGRLDPTMSDDGGVRVLPESSRVDPWCAERRRQLIAMDTNGLVDVYEWEAGG